MNKITTKRMVIYPISDEEMQKKINEESDEGMKIAYSEMLAGCKQNPEQRIWNAIWVMEKSTEDKAIIGDLSFKGLNNGVVEIGYGIKKEYENQGFMTEAVTAMAQWASKQIGVLRVEAETDLDNVASSAVLKKAGFIATGMLGEEGPKFVWKEDK